MRPLNEWSRSDLVYGLMLEALRVADGRLNALAVECLGRLGPPVVRRLALEASCRGAGPARRLRMLAAIRRIGVIPDPETFLDLFALTGHKDVRVRAAAVALIVDLGGKGAVPEESGPEVIRLTAREAGRIRRPDEAAPAGPRPAATGPPAGASPLPADRPRGRPRR